METVLSHLEKTYGDTDRKPRLQDGLWRTKELALDMECLKEGSFWEELDELNVEIIIRESFAEEII